MLTPSFASFHGPSDAAGLIVMAALCLMSVLCWSQAIIKLWEQIRFQRRARAFLERFSGVSGLPGLRALQHEDEDLCHARLIRESLHAWEKLMANQHPANAAEEVLAISQGDEFVIRAMGRVLAEEELKQESGLALLASIGTSAPFIGLFGTVWGIYHALLSIGQGTQATLDRVAGPVGEALVMTAGGLAVAVPAVLLYNTLVRRQRVQRGNLDSFAHDLYLLLVSGARNSLRQCPAAEKPRGILRAEVA
ncbi:MAG: MotA/TolQ/ExbB proton channel family protein [Azonexus sp.]